MGIFDFVGNFLSTAIDGAESLGSGMYDAGSRVADMAGNALGGSIDCVESGFEFVSENPGTALLTVGATVASAGLGLAAAPAIASMAGSAGILGMASTQTAISTLSGAALTNASLAAIGGGALAVGGGGIAAGTAVIGAAGAVTGAASSVVAAKTWS